MSLKRKLIQIVYKLFRKLPVKQNEVLIFCYYGEQYSGSPKYIGEYLLNKSEIDVVWSFVDLNKHKNVKGKKIRYGHARFYKHLATAGTIITNYRMTSEFAKRKGQKYIQTWHSSLRLKMIEKDAIDTLPINYINMAKKDSKQIDYLLAGSSKSREIFEKAFWYSGKIVNTGTPQCDVFFKDSTRIKEKVFKYYGIPKGSHVVMYAPTFRKDHDTSVYDLNTEVLLLALKKKFGGKWYLLMRLHPHLINLKECFQYTSNVLQATDYDDVQELLCATDILISDYSAIMFDFMLTKRPCFLYTPDFIKYTTKDRRLYFNIKELPFPSFEDQSKMLKAISDFSKDKYEEKVEKFMHKLNSFDDGNANERVYKLIKGEK